MASALTIAGSDSGGGAGIQADLKTFLALGVHGTSAITCLTAQNPKAVIGVESASPKSVQQQIQAVFDELAPAAVKTGMLYSTEIISVVVEFFQSGERPPLVVDPVMVSTSGARLLKESAIEFLIERLLPLSALVTPNLDEAQLLVGGELKTVEDLRAAARFIYERCGCAVLVKGGHLRASREAADIFFDGETELLLGAPFVKGVSTHGTGCTYSAAITAHVAQGQTLVAAVTKAKDYITKAIVNSRRVGGHFTLAHSLPTG